MSQYIKKENIHSSYEVVLQFKIWIEISIVQYFRFFRHVSKIAKSDH